VGLFLEDVGQESFLVALIRRLAVEAGFNNAELHIDTRNATGGKGRATTEFRRFLRDMQRGRQDYFDLIVVAIDGNCQGYQAKRRELAAMAEQTGYAGDIVYAVPDPHIERWYLEDVSGLSQTVEEPLNPDVPAYKCEKARYKTALRDALQEAGIYAPLGGIEYGEDLVEYLDLYRVGQADAGFRHFVDELQGWLRRFQVSEQGGGKDSEAPR
jgi:hypothetical protein